ncbi:YqaJ viral recombinase family protein [Plantactinospora sp. WMMB782]|uniref:YqaJ viral recombinase family nuclease n=1 Tax=Plantactinospora sp. WMMB782 TaxID=3404121 RepID=UPI003B953FAB
MTGPVPAIGWDATEDEWLYARRFGLGGSDILAVLGFSTYQSPWEVWAEKKGVRSWQDQGSHAADLGRDLEPWLMEQAVRILGVPVHRSEYRTYQHPEHSWRLCSPDGIIDRRRICEFKTAGLASGYGTPAGWTDGGTPLGYEFQVRWSMHVMDADVAEVIGLVAGVGLVHRTIVRDVAIEHELVGQVTDWYERHILGGEEPALGAVDNEAMARLFPRSNGRSVDLSDHPDVLELRQAYLDARARESAAKRDKETAGASLKKLLGDNDRATVDDHLIATWSEKKGAVDWPALVAELVEKHSIPAPNPEAYRKPSTRSLNVKGA